MNRYIVTTVRTDAPDVEYRIEDTQRGNSLATCWVRSDADMIAAALNQPEGEATSLLREIDASGVLYAHNLDLDAKVANFLNSRRPQLHRSQEDK